MSMALFGGSLYCVLYSECPLLEFTVFQAFVLNSYNYSNLPSFFYPTIQRHKLGQYIFFTLLSCIYRPNWYIAHWTESPINLLLNSSDITTEIAYCYLYMKG